MYDGEFFAEVEAEMIEELMQISLEKKQTFKITGGEKEVDNFIGLVKRDTKLYEKIEEVFTIDIHSSADSKKLVNP